MSRTQPTEWQTAQLGFGCPYCGEAPGVWCSRPSGWSAYLHAGRHYLAARVLRGRGGAA